MCMWCSVLVLVVVVVAGVAQLMRLLHCFSVDFLPHIAVNHRMRRLHLLDSSNRRPMNATSPPSQLHSLTDTALA